MAAPRPKIARARELSDDMVVYVDSAVVVVDKPAGISTVAFDESEADDETLDALVRDLLVRRERRGGRKDLRGRAPLGVVQRLDKATSGVLVFARTVAAKKHLAQQLRVHSMHRRYLCLAHGDVPKATHRSHLVEDRGDGLRGSVERIAARTGRPVRKEGQLAVTHVEPVERLDGATLVACRLETGRTHQIRIHLAEAGHPVVGERVYVRDYAGTLVASPRLMLHAAELGFDHPDDDRPVRFSRPPPADFEAVLSRLRR